jgi:hypothetical protein
MPKKKPNPQDATLRNIRALQKKVRLLEAMLRGLYKILPRDMALRAKQYAREVL